MRMKHPRVAARFVLAALAAVVVAAPASTLAASITKSQAQRTAKRAASRYIERFGISYPPSLWKAACRHAQDGVWRCELGTNGQCSGRVSVYGTATRPRTRNVRIGCFD
jgi:hypothetical protein